MGLRERINATLFSTNKGNKTVTKRGPGQPRQTQASKVSPTANSPFQLSKQRGEAYYKSKFQWLFDPVKGVQWDFNPVQVREIAQDDAWVQMLVNNIASEISNMPWQIVEDDNPEVAKSMDPFERVAKGKTGKQADPMARRDAEEFFTSPNPDEDFTDFTEQIIADYFEVGSFVIPKMFAESDYDGDELVSDNPQLVYAKPSDPVTFTKEFHDKSGIVSGYWQYDSNTSHRQRVRGIRSGRSKPIRFEPRELAWKDIHPRTNRRYGLPPTLAVKDFLMLLDLTLRQEQDYWSRGAFPAGFIRSDGDIEEIEFLKDEAQGEQGRQGGIMHISDPDADFVQMAYNWSDMQVTEREQWYAKVIAAEFQVPVSVVGLKPEEVNRSTFEGERDNFESNTLGPYLHDLERLFTSMFVKPHFDSRLRFEFIPGMSENQKSSISGRVREEFNSNLITRSEARQQLGYEEVEEVEDGFKDDVVEDSGGDGLMDQLQQSEDSSRSAVGKPFGPWDSFDQCVMEMQDEQGYDQETARRVCGSLQAELKDVEKGEEDRVIKETVKEEAGNVCKQESCISHVPKDNKKFCSKSCYTAYLSKEDDETETGDYLTDEAEEDDDYEPLRGTENFFEYDFQPRHVEQFKESLQGPLREALKQILTSDKFNQLVERFAEEEQHDTTQKNSAELRRVLNDLIKDAALSRGLEEIIRDQNVSIAVATLEDQIGDTGLDADMDEVAQQVQDMDVSFTNRFAQRMEEDIRDIVSQGWQQGQSIQEIQENLQEKADELTDYQAERIARDQLQRATGQARNNFAQQHSDMFVEVWDAVEDDRTRPAHEEMGSINAWKYPHESFSVPYERASGPVKEKTPGDSEYGIQCRCRTQLLPKEDVVNQAGYEHRGV